MNTTDFLNNFIHPSCHKVQHDVTEYNQIKQLEGIKMIKATALYNIYKHNVFTNVDRRLTMKQFFHICGQYLYYDKYVCRHGTEFYYYVKFNDANELYQIAEPILLKQIDANAPDTLDDLKYVIEAVTRV